MVLLGAELAAGKHDGASRSTSERDGIDDVLNITRWIDQLSLFLLIPKRNKVGFSPRAIRSDGVCKSATEGIG